MGGVCVGDVGVRGMSKLFEILVFDLTDHSHKFVVICNEGPRIYFLPYKIFANKLVRVRMELSQHVTLLVQLRREQGGFLNHLGQISQTSCFRKCSKNLDRFTVTKILKRSRFLGN